MAKVWREGVIVEYLGESSIRFTCPEGHVTTETLRIGPKIRGKGRIVSPSMTKRLAKYWANRVVYKCKKCE